MTKTTSRKLASTAAVLILSTAWGIPVSAVHATDQRTAQSADKPADCTKNPDDKRCADK